MSLFFALVAVLCAALVAWVFILAWLDQDVVAAAVLGIALFSLAVVAIVALRVAL